jgi:hypothetical protein
VKAKRVVFEVRYVKNEQAWGGGGWEIFQEGTALGHCFAAKTDAVKTAVDYMKLEERSELKVKNKQGRISERRTWPRSSDPKGRG